MPKIVDRDARRRELVSRAVVLFRERGYSGLGMRQIAKELGVPKSTLYHYFSSKEELFAACTEQVTALGATALTVTHDPVEALVDLARAMAAEFPGELSLLVDYLRGSTPTQIAADPTMGLANARYLAAVESITGPEPAKGALIIIYGWLLQQWVDGGQTDTDELTALLTVMIARSPSPSSNTLVSDD